MSKKSVVADDHESYKTCHIYVDGAATPNPGSMSVGVYIKDWAGNFLYEGGGYIGQGSNNEAEYLAVVAGLLTAEVLGYRFAEVYSDSQVVVKTLRGEHKLHAPALIPLAAIAKKQISRFHSVEITQIPRTQNQEADAITQKVLTKGYKNEEYKAWLDTEVARLKGKGNVRNRFG